MIGLPAGATPGRLFPSALSPAGLLPPRVERLDSSISLFFPVIVFLLPVARVAIFISFLDSTGNPVVKYKKMALPKAFGAVSSSCPVRFMMSANCRVLVVPRKAPKMKAEQSCGESWATQ